MRPNNVDVCWVFRNTLLEALEALVDERIEAASHDLLGGDFTVPAITITVECNKVASWGRINDGIVWHCYTVHGMV